MADIAEATWDFLALWVSQASQAKEGDFSSEATLRYVRLGDDAHYRLPRLYQIRAPAPTTAIAPMIAT